MAKVLVACEYSGKVRDAFIAAGHDALSCDLLPSDVPGPHYQGDVTDILGDGWDLMVAHPPCTHLSVSGARWWPQKQADGRQQEALTFVRLLLDADIPRIAVENPVSLISTAIRPASQYVQPWQFGHGETKKTGLWLVNLPLLTPTDVVEGREQRVWRMAPSPDRWKQRSETFTGIAAAMAAQWGPLLDQPIDTRIGA
jgi:site-specific DNA-cytosine methylase